MAHDEARHKTEQRIANFAIFGDGERQAVSVMI
jgi:hypothetical protein